MLSVEILSIPKIEINILDYVSLEFNLIDVIRFLHPNELMILKLMKFFCTWIFNKQKYILQTINSKYSVEIPKNKIQLGN